MERRSKGVGGMEGKGEGGSDDVKDGASGSG